MYLRPTAVIRTTFETVTPESAVEGCADDQGWIDEEGTVYTFSEAFALVKGCEPSSSHFHKGIWYTHDKYHEDFRTGADTSRSYHLSGSASERFQRRLFNAVKAAQKRG